MLAFIHIPKSAGTSIANWLSRNTSNNLLILERDWHIYNVEPEEISRTNIVFGHFSFDTAQQLACNSLAFFLRDPIMRVISQIGDWQFKQVNSVESDTSARYRLVIDPNLSFEENLVGILNSAEELPERYCDVSNTATYQLGGHVYNRSKSLDDAVKRSIENIENSEFFGIYEHMEESLLGFSKTIGLAFPHALESHNSGRVNTANLLANLKPSTISLIKRRNEADLFLYNKALLHFRKLHNFSRHFNLTPCPVAPKEVNSRAADVLAHSEPRSECIFTQRFLQILSDVHTWNANQSGTAKITNVNGCSLREYNFLAALAQPENLTLFCEADRSALPSTYEPILNPASGAVVPAVSSEIKINNNILIFKDSWRANTLTDAIASLTGPNSVIVLGQAFSARKPINITNIQDFLSKSSESFVPAALIDQHLYLCPPEKVSSLQDLVRAKLNDQEILRGRIFGYECLTVETNY